MTTEGSMVVLTCEAVGKPLPTLTWVGSVSVENTTSVTMVMGGTRSMVAFNATRQMNGTQLTCQASGRGVASQSVLLQVKGAHVCLCMSVHVCVCVCVWKLCTFHSPTPIAME